MQCPTWSDFTCAAPAGSRLARAYLEQRRVRVHAATVTKKVAVSLATKAPKAVVSNNGRSGHAGKRLKIPVRCMPRL